MIALRVILNQHTVHIIHNTLLHRLLIFDFIPHNRFQFRILLENPGHHFLEIIELLEIVFTVVELTFITDSGEIGIFGVEMVSGIQLESAFFG